MLNLYMLEGCPFCKKVMDFAEANNISLHMFNITNPDNTKKLISLGGKEQVPFLQNEQTGEKMYESDDIIEYLKTLNRK